MVKVVQNSQNLGSITQHSLSAVSNFILCVIHWQWSRQFVFSSLLWLAIAKIIYWFALTSDYFYSCRLIDRRSLVITMLSSSIPLCSSDTPTWHQLTLHSPDTPWTAPPCGVVRPNPCRTTCPRCSTPMDYSAPVTQWPSYHSSSLSHSSYGKNSVFVYHPQPSQVTGIVTVMPWVRPSVCPHCPPLDDWLPVQLECICGIILSYVYGSAMVSPVS